MSAYPNSFVERTRRATCVRQGHSNHLIIAHGRLYCSLCMRWMDDVISDTHIDEDFDPELAIDVDQLEPQGFDARPGELAYDGDG